MSGIFSFLHYSHFPFLRIAMLTVASLKGFKSETFFKSNTFTCTRILKHMSKIFGMSYSTDEFGFNYDSVIFVAMVICFGTCSLGTGFCWIGCNVQIENKKVVLLSFGLRFMQLGLLVCILKFRYSIKQVNRIFYLSHQLSKNAGFVSFKYHRRNFVISTLFLLWIFSKLGQLRDIHTMRMYSQELFLRYGCTYMSTWPIMILSWQFLRWMQVFSSSLKASLDELRSAVIQAQDTPSTKYERQILECVSRVKTVFKFKQKILHVYGPSIIFSQLRSSVWIMMNAYHYTYRKHVSKVTLLISTFVFNIVVSFLPHWVGQEISTEGLEMLHSVLTLQVERKPLIFDKKLSNFLVGLLHEDPKFRVCNLFDLTHKQFLSFLSISVGFLIMQLQMLF